MIRNILAIHAHLLDQNAERLDAVRLHHFEEWCTLVHVECPTPNAELMLIVSASHCLDVEDLPKLTRQRLTKFDLMGYALYRVPLRSVAALATHDEAVAFGELEDAARSAFGFAV